MPERKRSLSTRTLMPQVLGRALGTGIRGGRLLTKVFTEALATQLLSGQSVRLPSLGTLTPTKPVTRRIYNAWTKQHEDQIVYPKIRFSTTRKFKKQLALVAGLPLRGKDKKEAEGGKEE